MVDKFDEPERKMRMYVCRRKVAGTCTVVTPPPVVVQLHRRGFPGARYAAFPFSNLIEAFMRA